MHRYPNGISSALNRKAAIGLEYGSPHRNWRGSLEMGRTCRSAANYRRLVVKLKGTLIYIPMCWSYSNDCYFIVQQVMQICTYGLLAPYCL